MSVRAESTATAPIGRLLDLKQAAAYTGLNYWHVRDLALSGHLPIVKLPSGKNPNGELRRILIDRADLDSLIDRMKGRNIEPVRHGSESLPMTVEVTGRPVGRFRRSKSARNAESARVSRSPVPPERD